MRRWTLLEPTPQMELSSETEGEKHRNRPAGHFRIVQDIDEPHSSDITLDDLFPPSTSHCTCIKVSLFVPRYARPNHRRAGHLRSLEPPHTRHAANRFLVFELSMVAQLIIWSGPPVFRFLHLARAFLAADMFAITIRPAPWA